MITVCLVERFFIALKNWRKIKEKIMSQNKVQKNIYLQNH
jgi:cell division protein FtsX